MIKIKYLTLSIGISFLVTPFITNANSIATDPLQYYRDEIKQAQNDAKQTLLNKLRPYTNNVNSYAHEAPTPSASATPLSEQSNTEKAFSPPPTTPKKQASDVGKAPTNNANNPWVKPNPWESQSKINPWANSPIPGPTPTTPPPANASLTPNNTPNIFAPPPPPKSGNRPLNNNNISY